MLIESGDIDISDINGIYIVVGGDHGQGAFRFPMKILYIMNDGTRHKSIQPVGCILYKKNNDIIHYERWYQTWKYLTCGLHFMQKR